MESMFIIVQLNILIFTWRGLELTFFINEFVISGLNRGKMSPVNWDSSHDLKVSHLLRGIGEILTDVEALGPGS